MGFEVVCSFADSMADSEFDLSKAIIAGGLAIAAIYPFSSFGISSALPADRMFLDSGITEVVAATVGDKSIIFAIVPLSGSAQEMEKTPMLLGVLAFAVLGEIVHVISARGRKEEYKGFKTTEN